MVRMHKTLEQQLAEIDAKQRQLKARQAKVEEQRKARDLRRRAKGEKALVTLTLDLAARQPGFKSDLLAALAMFPMKPEDRDAARWLLTGGTTDIAAAAPPAANEARSATGHPALAPTPQNARAAG